MPIAMPNAAENQMLAAVVRFLIWSFPNFRIIPAPKNPIPVTICAVILAGDVGSAIGDKKVKNIAPPITKMWVLIPAIFLLASLSAPIIKPVIKTKIILIMKSFVKGVKIFSSILLQCLKQYTNFSGELALPRKLFLPPTMRES